MGIFSSGSPDNDCSRDGGRGKAPLPKVVHKAAEAAKQADNQAKNNGCDRPGGRGWGR